ncbi:MAG: endolytic transglycosylase MltG [Fluviicola sp.]|nr:endolytic transglycosylase MltG [Fluviicola sp.]
MVKKIGLLGFALLIVFVFLYKDKIMSYFSEDTRSVNKREVKLLFREDPTLTELIDVLIEKEVIADRELIRSYVKENGIDSTRFAAGKYVILSKTQLSNLINGFVKEENGHGKAEVKVNVIFNNCPTIEAMAKNISQCILADSASLVEYIYKPSTLKKYGFTRAQVPALFLPKNYEMYFDTDAEAFVAFMANEFKIFWNSDRKAKMKEIGLKAPSQVTTLASIVYAEQSKISKEWPIVAKLYLNRLDKGMKLESDPTAKFCWGDELIGVERILYKHINIECDYNTYKINGLPPGPIYVTPGAVIDAVLSPADVNYIFMCGKPGGGGHNFALTNAQHERNARIYREWLKKYQRDKR